jgi:hypothetical protein
MRGSFCHRLEPNANGSDGGAGIGALPGRKRLEGDSGSAPQFQRRPTRWLIQWRWRAHWRVARRRGNTGQSVPCSVRLAAAGRCAACRRASLVTGLEDLQSIVDALNTGSVLRNGDGATDLFVIRHASDQRDDAVFRENRHSGRVKSFGRSQSMSNIFLQQMILGATGFRAGRRSAHGSAHRGGRSDIVGRCGLCKRRNRND